MTPPPAPPLLPALHARIRCIAWWKRSGLTEGRVVSVQGAEIEVRDDSPQTHYVTGEMVVEVLGEDAR